MASDQAEPLSPHSPWTGEYSPSLHQEPISPAGRHLAERRSSDSPTTSRAAVSVACTACRNRHLKCDGQKPCGRCMNESSECSYVKSRRGWKAPKNRGHGASSFMSGMAVTNCNQPVLTLSPQIDTSVLDASNLVTETIAMSPDGRYSFDFIGTTDMRGQHVILPPPVAQLPVDCSRAGLIDAFYSFFYPAHPFVLPRNHLLDLLQQRNVAHLDIAVQYIGSFYVIGANTPALQNALHTAITTFAGQKDAFFVQAMLLWAIGLHMSDQEQASANVMYNTITSALDLGLNRRSYATAAGGLGTTVEECFRRTWWEVFVCDGMFGGVNPLYTIQLGGVHTDVPIPIDDDEYLSGRIISQARTFEDYDDAAFLNDEIVFTSSAYRIDAVRIVHLVLEATRAEPVNPISLDHADTMLANWALHLPECKTRIIDRHGKVDEIMFEAHMIISACSILLHRPRSDLSNEDVKGVTTCINAAPMSLAGAFTDMHTLKSMNAAKDICVLIKVPCPLVKHSPFFTCAITMAAVVYLSYWSFIATEAGDNRIKEHIKLNIGSLKTLASVMPIAKTVLGQVKGVAKELFHSRKALSNLYWGGVTREEVFQGMIEENSLGAVPGPSGGGIPAPTAPPVGGWEVGFLPDAL